MLRVFIVMVVLIAPTSGPFAIFAQDFSLERGAQIEKEMGPAETHEYSWKMTAGQFALFVIQQKENDFAFRITVSGPDASVISDLYSVAAPPIAIPVSFVTSIAGEYCIRIQSLEKDKLPRRYVMHVKELRSATSQDSSRIQAQKDFLEAEGLRGKGDKESIRKSLELYDKVLPLYRTLGDATGEGILLTGMGRSYDALGEKKKAYDLYQQALLIHKRTKNGNAEANTLNYMGLVHDFLGERPQALVLLNQARESARDAGDRRAEALALNNLGLVYYNMGDKQKALEYYDQALPLHQAVKNLRGEATTLNNTGTVYDSIGEKQRSLECLQASLAVRRTVGDPAPVGISLNNIGALYFSMDEFEKALQFYQNALPLWKEAGDLMGEAATVHNIARVHHALGEYQTALRFYQQALQMQRSVKYRTGEGNILNSTGLVYSQLGDYRKALQSFQDALLIHRETKNSAGEAIALSNLGSVFDLTGEKQKALEYFSRALPLRQAVQDRYGEGITLNQIARVHISLGESQKAFHLCEQALPLMRNADSRRGEALTLDCLGSVNGFLGNAQKGVEYLDQAVKIFQSVRDPRGEATSNQNASKIESERGNFAEAAKRMESVIQIVESLRTKISSPDQRSLYFASVRDTYELYIDSLMQWNKTDPSPELDAVAFQAAEKAKARTLLEMLAEADVDILQGVDPALLEKERALLQLLEVKAEKQMRIVGDKANGRQIAAIGKEMDALTSQHREILSQLHTSSPDYAAMTQTQPMSLQEIQKQVLDSDTLLLEFSLGEKRSYLWAVSQNDLSSFELPGRVEIETAARKYYDLIRSNGDAGQISRSGLSLSRLLLSDVKSLSDKKRIVIVAEGMLQYVPFAALPDPFDRRALILKQEVISLPSASVLPLLRREKREHTTKTLALFADPVFQKQDPRVTGKTGSLSEGLENEHLVRSAQDFGIDQTRMFSRLIGTRREAARIASLIPSSERKDALDFDANRANATGAEISKYRIIHFATHGLLNSKHPDLSGLVLSLVDENGQPQNGFLRLQEIYNLKLPADLVVLSACQTALGQEIRGEGLVGLTRGFMFAGAARVVASLWKVDDKATAELMRLFYQKMLGNDRIPPAAAMRAAQIALQKQKRFQSPYYWAAFILQGEWN